MNEKPEDRISVPPNVTTLQDLQDWFAGMALSGLLAADTDGVDSDENVAFRAYALANRMLHERALRRGNLK